LLPTHKLLAVDDDVFELETERTIPVALLVISGWLPVVIVRRSDLECDPAAVESEALLALAEYALTGDPTSVVRLEDIGDSDL